MAVVVLERPVEVSQVVALRVLVAAAVAGTVLYLRTWRYGELAELAEAPRFAGWLEWLPFPGVVGTVALLAACVALAAGWRGAAVAVALLGLWVLGAPQMFGKVAHYHHLLWLPLLLAVPRPSVKSAQILLASCYLFPGLAKLLLVDWWATDQLKWMSRNIAYWNDWTMPVGLPSWMWMLLAVGTVILEVGFLFVTLTRWHRHAAVAGLGFHLGIWWLTGLVYWPLMIVYPIMFLRRGEDITGRLVLVAWGALLLAVSLPGVAVTQGWPVAAYPSFRYVAGPELRDVVYLRDGEVVHPGDELAPWAPVDVRGAIGRSGYTLNGACAGVADVDLRQNPAHVEVVEGC